MFKAVIFDFDDTLVKTFAIKSAHHKATAKEFYGIDLTDEEIRNHWGKPFDQLISHFYRNSDSVENMRAANMSTRTQFLKETYDGSVEVIEEFLSKGIQIGVLTSTNKEFVLDDLQRLGFPFEKFFCIQGADETDVHKPDPRVFDRVIDTLHALGIGKSEAVYVGDGTIDFLAARGAGLDFIGVTTGLTSVEEFEKEGVEKIIRDIRDLSTYVYYG